MTPCSEESVNFVGGSTLCIYVSDDASALVTRESISDVAIEAFDDAFVVEERQAASSAIPSTKTMPSMS